MTDFVDTFLEIIKQRGDREANLWLEENVADQFVLLQTKAYLNLKQHDPAAAEQSLRGALEPYLGSRERPPSSAENEDESLTTANALLEIIQKQGALPNSLPLSQLKDYLGKLQDNLRYLKEHNFRGDHRAGAKAPRLEKIFISRQGRLTTEDMKNGLSRQDKETAAPAQTGNLLALISPNKRLVITADPGMGKTFFLRHLCNLNITASDTFFPGVPVFVPLRKFAPWLREKKKASTDPSDSDLRQYFWDFLTAEWEESYPNLAVGLRDWLAAPEGHAQRHTVFLFDGLDEVTIEGSDRRHVSEMIVALSNHYPDLAIYATSRVRSYPMGEAPWTLRDPESNEPWPVCEILPFGKTEIRDFVDGWFDELSNQGWFSEKESKQLAGSFLTALEDPDCSSLSDLAPSPLMLTMMCIIHATEREMPKGRGDLYFRLINLLLGEWEKRRVRGAEGGIDRFDELCRKRAEITGKGPLDLDTFRRELAELVFELTKSFSKTDGTDSGILIPETRLKEMLRRLCQPGQALSNHPEIIEQADQWVGEMIGFIKEQGGLLDQIEGAGSDFVFPHRQYGEFLAGWYLVQFRWNEPDLIENLCPDYETWSDLWREPVLFGVSWLWSSEGEAILMALITRLLADPTPIRLQMAGEMLAEFADRDRIAAQWKQVEEKLTERMLGREDSVPDRIRFGVSLGAMGDGRRGVALNDNGAPDFLWSTELLPPQDGFLMGASDDDDEARESERPQFMCRSITQPYHIAIHPVTVAQFEAFVAANGYQTERWWTADGWKWKEAEKVEGPEYLGYSRYFSVSNVPVTGVSFFEALAFCKWLNDFSDDSPWEFDLPTEMEWEFAARGASGTLYPWGSENDDLLDRCHFGEAGISHPSAVGLFGTAGQSVASGLLDQSGNVWEWTKSNWSKYPDFEPIEPKDAKVLRGGSFDYVPEYLRSSARGRDPLGIRYNDFGFRVCCRPHFDPDS